MVGGRRYGGNLNANTVKCHKRHTETQRERGEGHMMTEAEIKEMYPHAREHLEPSEAGGDEERFSAREGAWSFWHTFIIDSGLQNCESINFYVLSHEVCGNLLQQPQKVKKTIYCNL